MRFRFCGDLDCPDWVLAEIQTLSKLSSVKFKLLTSRVVAAIASDDENGDDIDAAKIAKLCADAKFEWTDVQASVAALRFILVSSAKHGVLVDELAGEVQQLGLPKEHSIALGKVLGEAGPELRRRLGRKKTPGLDTLEDVGWRVDYVLGSSSEPRLRRAELQLRLDVRSADTAGLNKVDFALTPDQCRLLLKELKEAEKILSRVEEENKGMAEGDG